MAISADEHEALAAQLAERDAQLAERDAQLAECEAQIAELKEQLATALQAIATLTQQQKRNSTNSHLPPSSDGPGATARGVRKSKKKKSKRKRGGQKGRRGAHRQLLPVEQVHEFVDLFPAACEGCARPLPRAADIDARRYQRLELLLAGVQVTEWRRHAVTCTCGHETRAPYDADEIPASPFGPRLVSVVATLTGAYHLSRRRAQLLLRELFGIEISLGAISQMEARMSKSLVSAVEEARADVVSANVKHTDATSWLLAGVTMSMWVLSTQLTSYFRIFKDGCRATIESTFKDDEGRFVGILNSDRASVFGFWVMALRQICWAHLLRKFVSFSERDGPVGRFGRELLDHARIVFDYWRGFCDGELTRAGLQNWMDQPRRRFEALLERAAACGLEGLSGSCADMLVHREALWTFVDVEGVEPTNNLAERDLRELVIWRKRCFGSQSLRGLRFVERVMTVVQTLRKRGRGVLDYLERTVAASFVGAPVPSLLGA